MDAASIFDTLRLIRGFVAHETVPIPEYPLNPTYPYEDPPKFASVREIEIKTDSGPFEIACTRAKHRDNITPRRKLETILSEVTSVSGYTYGDTYSPKKPYKSNLSTNNSGRYYLIIKIKNDNLQFPYEGDPFSIELKAIAEGYYRTARRVDVTGRVLQPGEKEEGCKVAYFICDGRRHPSGQLRDFVHRFNIHLEWVTEGMDAQGNTVTSYVPIIIDPDVRYPGGTGNP